MPAFAHDYPFDPAYGHDEAALRRVPAPEGPADFDAFWKATREEALAIPLRLERREVESLDPAYRLEEVFFDSFGGFRTGAWLAVPRSGKVARAVVAGHGYGGREVPAVAPDAAMLSVFARGFGLSRRDDIPGESPWHVLHGIGTREGYVLRGCVAELWAGFSVLEELFPALAGRLFYRGGSFGGGLGALMVPWETRCARAFLDVPTFGNHPLRVTLPCIGSGAAVTARWKRDPKVLDVLAYFDAATAARRIAVPTLVAPALFDPAVPPPGQFAVANAIREGLRGEFLHVAGHFDYPEFLADEERMEERIGRWWGE